MADDEDQLYSLPVSGHYDIGYSYGSTAQTPARTQPQSLPQQILANRNRNPMYGTIADRRPSYLQNARPRSPPTVLPLSFTNRPTVTAGTYTIPEDAPLQAYCRQDSVVASPTTITDAGLPNYAEDRPPPVPPKSNARSHSDTLPRGISSHQDTGSESDLSTISSRSRQLSTQSVDTTASATTTTSLSTAIEPDILPSHSNPQWLSPTQSAAFSGPRPIQPMRLGRREVCDSHTGEAIFQISDETKLKLSQQAIYQVYEAASSSIIGTLGYAMEASDEVAAILRGQDVVLKRESPSGNRWCFRPSSLTKKGAFWYWSRDKLRGDIILSDARKGGMVIARIQRDVLSFERAGLDLNTVNEICFSAMALAELARRNAAFEDSPHLAAAIATVALGETACDKHSDEDGEPPLKPKRRLTLNRNR